MNLHPGARLGPYELLGELGKGGMGVVYAATDTRLGRRVAIKLLPTDAVADPDRLRRFMQEARAASALSHPHIAHVYDIVDLPPEGGSHSVSGIVMELVEGTTLDKLIATGPLPVRTALEYASQIGGRVSRQDVLDGAVRGRRSHADVRRGHRALP